MRAIMSNMEIENVKTENESPVKPSNQESESRNLIANGNGHNFSSNGDSSCSLKALNGDDTLRPVKKRALCEMCQDEESKYTCPGCGIKTCSLPCVKSHKLKLDCSGERDKAEFVDLTKYNDRHLLNDYRFLEDAERTLFSHRDVQHKRLPHTSSHITKRSKLLINAAMNRGVKLKILPHFLTRNKENSSYFTIKSDSIAWHIDWLFTTKSAVVKVKDGKVDETTRLVEAASKFTNVVEFPHYRKPLEEFNKDNMSACQFLLKVEGFPANMPRFSKLGPDLTITTNLKGHSLIEYPTIHVLSPTHNMEGYTLLSKEDIPHMSPDQAKHFLRHHPELSLKEAIIGQLLNPKSDIFTTQPNSLEQEVTQPTVTIDRRGLNSKSAIVVTSDQPAPQISQSGLNSQSAIFVTSDQLPPVGLSNLNPHSAVFVPHFS